MKFPVILTSLLLTLVLSGCTSEQQKQFTDVSATSGIHFANNITESETLNIFTYEYMYNGGGVAVGDVNGDGLADVYFTANQLPNQLYLNKGNLQFEDITTAAHAAGRPGWKTGVSMTDVNADGLLDIYVCHSGNGDVQSRSNELLINKGVQNGIPVFEDEARQYGLDAPGTNSNQAVFFDYDRDGDLDMFLLNHATMFYSPLVNTYRLRHLRHPYFSNFLYRNDGGHFTDVSATAGVAGGGNNFGLGIVASDINGDGWPDLYMTNDYEEQDFLLLNNRDGTFREVTKQSLKHISKYGMGCDVADYNNDGRMDIMVPDMWPEDNYRQKALRGPDEYDRYHLLVDSGYMHQNMRNTLQLNCGDAKDSLPQFSEIGQLAGISATDWSWSSLLADMDNDGYKDLFVSNGFWRDYSNMDFQLYTVAKYREENGAKASLSKLIEQMPQTRLSNYGYRNRGDLSFENVTDSWGLHTSNVSNGAAYADLDNDGDLDLVVNNMGENASIYRNNNNGGGHFLTLKLKGLKGNTTAVGSQVTLTTKSGRQQTAEQQPVRGYLSCMAPMVHFGLGNDTALQSVSIRWPTGGYTLLQNIKTDQLITVDEATAKKDSLPQKAAAQPVFGDYTAVSGIDFRQKENAFVDFKQEYLLPWQLSRQGPKMSVGDVNGDGLEDVFIGAPKGQSARLYLQQQSGKFALSPSQPWQADSLCEDVESAFADLDSNGDPDLYVVSGGNENREPDLLQDRIYLNNGKGVFIKTINALPPMGTAKSCITVGDYDTDGKPDIFVGGRLVAGQYGVSPPSYLLHNETVNGSLHFTDVTATVAPALQQAGMITTATWTDLDNDHRPDLLVAGEWMPVKAFINQNGRLEDKSPAIGLDNTNGLWTCIKPMDMDGDGDTDFMMGNLAPNTLFRASVQQPLTLCVNDFLKTGSVLPILCQYIQGENYPYASRNELVEAMPPLSKKFLYYKDYATARLSDVFTPEQLKGMQELKVTQLRNCWLENTGNGKLVLHELPMAAQFSAIQGAIQTDVNGDGKPEIFAAGNFYPFRVQLGREDAGKGILLQWDKQKHQLIQSPLPPGIFADGDIRDIATVHTADRSLLVLLSENDDQLQVLKIKR